MSRHQVFHLAFFYLSLIYFCYTVSINTELYVFICAISCLKSYMFPCISYLLISCFLRFSFTIATNTLPKLGSFKFCLTACMTYTSFMIIWSNPIYLCILRRWVYLYTTLILSHSIISSVLNFRFASNKLNQSVSAFLLTKC